MDFNNQPRTLQDVQAALVTKRKQLTEMTGRYPNISATEVKDIQKLNEEVGDLADRAAQLKQVQDIWRDSRDGSGSGAEHSGLVLKSGDKLADRVPKHDGAATFGAYIKGVVSGVWDGPEGAEAKAMAIGTGSAGGFLVPEPLSARVIDLARAQAAVLRAGAQTIPMSTTSVRIAVVAEDIVPIWHVENAADVPVDDLVLGSVLLTAKTLPVIVKCSRELFEDAANLDTVVSQSVAAALALELDRAALYGLGTVAIPRGIKNTPGVPTVSLGAAGAALTNYDPIIDAMLLVMAGNYQPNAAVLAPRTAGALAKLKDTTGQPLQVPPAVMELQRYITTQVPINLAPDTATNASDIFVGQWNQLLIGVRSTIQIELLRERFVENWQFAFSAHLRADVAVAAPGAFAIVTNIEA